MNDKKYDTQKPITSITIKISSNNIHTIISNFKEKNQNITTGDVILHAICRKLIEYPEFNTLYKAPINKNFNVGYIINLGKGSTTAIIQSAQDKTITEISSFIKEFALNHLRNQTNPQENLDCVFLVTNLASFNSYIVKSPLYENTSSIVSIGSEYDSIIYTEGTIKPIKEFTITLTYDSRLADCQKALQFLNSIKNLLEQDPQI